MKVLLIAGAFVAGVVPTAIAHHDITLRGCVVPGLDKGTFVMSQVSEVVPPGGPAMPQTAHGRRVVFWLDEEKDLRSHAGMMVEVRGEVDHDVTEAEIELKAGPHKDGGLIVEFEGPGKDVRTSNKTVGAAVGTSGRTEPGSDVKTFVVKIDVDELKRVEGTCNR